MTTLLDYLVQHEPSFRKQRLPALYSDFAPQRTLNPDGYQANISAWRNALSSIARSGLAPASKDATAPSLLVLDVDERLARALESKQFGRPLCLGVVVAEAVAAKDIVPLKEFLTAKESVYHRPWTVLSPWALAGWVARQLGVAEMWRGRRGDRVPVGRFVVVKNVEEAGEGFARAVQGVESRFERIYSVAQFRREFAGRLVEGRRLSGTDVDVLLRFLDRDKGVVVYDGRTVKIRAGDDTTLTEEDEGIAQLKELLGYLTHQTEVLSTRVEELGETAKQAVVKKNRVAALAALKSKKLAETTLAARFNTLSQLEETANKIQQAADNVALVRVMEGSGEALRRLNSAVGGAEGVEGVVERLRSQMDTADEVNSILTDAEAAGGVVVDEGEIDDELAVMESEEKAKEEAERKKVEDEKKRVEEEKKAAEAEEVRKRLEAAGSVPETQKESDTQVETAAGETAEELSRMTLGEEKEAEPPLAA